LSAVRICCFSCSVLGRLDWAWCVASRVFSRKNVRFMGVHKLSECIAMISGVYAWVVLVSAERFSRSRWPSDDCIAHYNVGDHASRCVNCTGNKPNTILRRIGKSSRAGQVNEEEMSSYGRSPPPPRSPHPCSALRDPTRRGVTSALHASKLSHFTCCKSQLHHHHT